MGKVDKILNKMMNNPLDWRIDALKTVANSFGVEWRQPGTSHVTFRHPNGSKLFHPISQSRQSIGHL